MHDALWITLLLGIVVALFVGGGYWWSVTHVHTDEYLEATIIGMTVVTTGSGWSSSSESRCLFLTENEERVTSKNLCEFIVGDDVVIYYHDNYEKNITLRDDKK